MVTLLFGDRVGGHRLAEDCGDGRLSRAGLQPVAKTVLEAGSIPARDFPDRSMAFAGTTDPLGTAGAMLSAAFSGNTSAGNEVLDRLRGVVVREDEWLKVA